MKGTYKSIIDDINTHTRMHTHARAPTPTLFFILIFLTLTHIFAYFERIVNVYIFFL